MQTTQPASALLATLFGTLAVAQCTSAWLPTNVSPGVSGSVHAATVWDPDGAGPQRARLVIGGTFQSAMGTAVANIAAIDPDTGIVFSLGSGLSGTVYALTTMTNGDLVAGGNFYNAGSTYVSSLARWNGSTWLPIGGGVSSIPLQSVYALAALPNGGLVAGGVFTWAGSTSAFYIARWNGSQWQPLGTGMNSWVGSLAVLQNGDIVAGGSFTQAGGVAANRIARWDGNGWNPLGQGVDSYVTSLAVRANGDLVAGGWFSSAGGGPANAIARWNGNAWSAVGGGCNGHVQSLLAQPNGDLIVGGAFTLAGGAPHARVARYSGNTWQALGSGFDAEVRALVGLPDGDSVAAGDFTATGTASLAHLARFRSGTWQILAGHTDPGSAIASVLMPDGAMVVAVGNAVSRWNGTSWAQLGDMGNTVTSLAVSDQGVLAAGGYFGVALRNGTSWQTLPPVPSPVKALAWTPAHELVVATSNFSSPVQLWNGIAWSPLGSGLPGSVQALTIRANGDVVAAGSIAQFPVYVSPFLAVWDGVTWQTNTLASQIVYGGVSDLLAMANGDVVVAGTLAADAHVMRWDGTAAIPLGSFGGLALQGALSLALLPTGEIAASATNQATSRWDGTNWIPLGSDSGHRELLVLPNGEIAALGSHARFASTCFASARDLASNCIGPAGPVTLHATSLPWLGSTLDTTATGFAPAALALSVFGFSPLDLPLSVVSPAALPNCNLLASPDATSLLVPIAGTCTQSLAIPNVAALVGTPLFHQFVQCVLGGPTGILSLSASNGLALLIGGY